MSVEILHAHYKNNTVPDVPQLLQDYPGLPNEIAGGPITGIWLALRMGVYHSAADAWERYVAPLSYEDMVANAAQLRALNIEAPYTCLAGVARPGVMRVLGAIMSGVASCETVLESVERVRPLSHCVDILLNNQHVNVRGIAQMLAVTERLKHSINRGACGRFSEWDECLLDLREPAQIIMVLEREFDCPEATRIALLQALPAEYWREIRWEVQKITAAMMVGEIRKFTAEQRAVLDEIDGWGGVKRMAVEKGSAA